MVFPAVGLYLERAFGEDPDVVRSSWVSDLETSCVVTGMGQITPSLKMNVDKAAGFVLCLQLFPAAVTRSLLPALCWGSVTSPGAVQSSILICSCDLLPRVSDRAGDVVATLVITSARTFMIARII